MSDIKRLHVGERMSQTVIYNGMIWLAGQVGEPSGSVAEQTQNILDKIDSLLAEAGSDKSKILQATIWLSSMEYFAEMNEVWDKWVAKGNAPARACGEAKLATPDYKVEILITAAV
ncbi:RidA family protein [Sneathiella glossodoripedis]|uniref:RidA family protein n=1 Tax=Sneathiella glossodoripedis TaxID=418853 RepID=UPI000471FA05|nr:RidA family protein [Sneathiella glossodoripedis]